MLAALNVSAMNKIYFGYWYSVLFGLVVLVALFGPIEGISYSGTWQEAPVLTKVLVPITLVTFLGFWFLMLGDFFKERDVSHPIAVGFCLIFLSWLAAFFYFWLVVVRRETFNK